MRLYMAHPITGLSGAEVLDYYDSLKAALSPYHTLLSPMTGKEALRTEPQCQATGYVTNLSNDHSIFQRDTWMVSQADIILVDFTGAQRVSIGCCMELAIGSFLNKHTVVVMDDIHRHSFTLEAADVIFPTLDEAVEYIMKLK